MSVTFFSLNLAAVKTFKCHAVAFQSYGLAVFVSIKHVSVLRDPPNTDTRIIRPTVLCVPLVSVLTGFHHIT